MKVKVVICVLIILILIPILYTQVIRPVKIQAKEVKCITAWDAMYEPIKVQAEKIINEEYNKNMVFIHSFKGELPSDNPDDYTVIYYTLDINNRSIFHMNSVEAVVLELGDYAENVLFSYSSSDPVPGRVWRLSKSDITFMLDVYTADMDEVAIKDLVKGIKVKVISEGDYIGIREEVVDIGNCKNIIVEFAE